MRYARRERLGTQGARKVVDTFSFAAKDRPDMSVLSDEFLDFIPRRTDHPDTQPRTRIARFHGRPRSEWAIHSNARLDLEALARIGVIGPEPKRRLQHLRELRRLLEHEYATATPEQVHEAAGIIANEFIPFYDAYRDWISRGFSPAPKQ